MSIMDVMKPSKSKVPVVMMSQLKKLLKKPNNQLLDKAIICWNIYRGLIPICL
ncbi:MAG: hypothetical protein JWP45_3377 [Mucilaginibacter sp.]|nr:hypothetical protein [Mucilaginibacter sp.]MDB5139929.1 hypothetical protein [Mucilaginibacter sp.]